MKKLLISLTILLSSIFFTSNAKAFSNDDIYYFYYQDNINNIINSDNFKNALENIKNEIDLKSNSYKNYIIDFWKNGSALYLRYFYFNVDDVKLVYNCTINSRYPNDCFSKINYNFSNIDYIRYNLVDMSVYSSTYNAAQIGNSYKISQTFDNMNFINNHLIDNLYFIYDTNINITSNFNFKDKNDNLLNYIPKVLKNEPTIDFTYNNNITTINDTNYITSKDVTMIVDNYDSNTQLLQYQFVKNGENLTDNWITHVFANNENTLTLNYKENGSLYTRILDIENNYEFITSNTFTFDDIDTIDITNGINPDIDNNNDEDTMLYSIDIYTSNNKNYDFEIFYNDKNNYKLNNISKADIDCFKFYGLKNNNDLYSWEQIIDTSFMIDYTDNNYIKTNNGFYFKASVTIPDHEYEKIKLAIVLKNAHKYEIQVNTSEQFDFNFLGDNYSRYKTSLEINKLIVFSSYETQSDFIYILNNKAKVFADYYNTQNYNFESFGLIDYYKTFRNNTFNRFYYENIGYKNNKGFYLKTNDNDFNEYYFYIKPGLYFSLVRNLPDAAATIIDENGNIVKEILKYYEYEYENYNSILDIFNIIKNNNSEVLTSKITEIWNIFKTDKKIYNYLILLIAISLIILLLKSMKS